jgi:hypothetical protein
LSQIFKPSIGSGPPPPGIVETLTANLGTNPVPPNASDTIFIGTALVSARSVPITTVGISGSNTIDIQAQLTSAQASSAANFSGLSSFNSTNFSVDSNGYVSSNPITVTGGTGVVITGSPVNLGGTVNIALSGTGVGQTITGNDGNVLAPTAGNWNIFGSSVLAHLVPVTTVGNIATSTLTVDVQLASANAASSTTRPGLASFNSNNFTVDVNGYVSAIGNAINYTNVTHAMSPYTVLTSDYYLSVDCSGGAVTLNFPNAPTFKQIWIIKDRTGNASTSNITITTPGATVTIDGLTSYVMTSNYQAINLLANASPTYEIY